MKYRVSFTALLCLLVLTAAVPAPEAQKKTLIELESNKSEDFVSPAIEDAEEPKTGDRAKKSTNARICVKYYPGSSDDCKNQQATQNSAPQQLGPQKPGPQQSDPHILLVPGEINGPVHVPKQPQQPQPPPEIPNEEDIKLLAGTRYFDPPYYYLEYDRKAFDNYGMQPMPVGPSGILGPDFFGGSVGNYGGPIITNDPFGQYVASGPIIPSGPVRNYNPSGPSGQYVASGPIIPSGPVGNHNPSGPSDRYVPSGPIIPSGPVGNYNPSRPSGRYVPSGPIIPSDSVDQYDPSNPINFGGPVGGYSPAFYYAPLGPNSQYNPDFQYIAVAPNDQYSPNVQYIPVDPNDQHIPAGPGVPYGPVRPNYPYTYVDPINKHIPVGPNRQYIVVVSKDPFNPVGPLVQIDPFGPNKIARPNYGSPSVLPETPSRTISCPPCPATGANQKPIIALIPSPSAPQDNRHTVIQTEDKDKLKSPSGPFSLPIGPNIIETPGYRLPNMQQYPESVVWNPHYPMRQGIPGYAQPSIANYPGNGMGGRQPHRFIPQLVKQQQEPQQQRPQLQQPQQQYQPLIQLPQQLQPQTQILIQTEHQPQQQQLQRQQQQLKVQPQQQLQPLQQQQQQQHSPLNPPTLIIEHRKPPSSAGSTVPVGPAVISVGPAVVPTIPAGQARPSHFLNNMRQPFPVVSPTSQRIVPLTKPNLSKNYKDGPCIDQGSKSIINPLGKREVEKKTTSKKAQKTP